MEGRLLTVTETAAALGVSDDTVRRFVQRGELARVDTKRGARFNAAQVERLRRTRGDDDTPTAPEVPEAPARMSDAAASTAPAPVPPAPVARPSANDQARAAVEGARADVEVAAAKVERRKIIRASQSEEEAAERARSASAKAERLAARLAALKAYGVKLGAQYPPSVRAALTRELEANVIPANFPDWLEDESAREFVADLVAQVAQPWKDAQAAEQREREAAARREREAAAAKSEAEQRERDKAERARRRAAIVDHGVHSIWTMLIGWDDESKALAESEVRRILESEVGTDWTWGQASARARAIVETFEPVEDDEPEDVEDDEHDDDDGTDDDDEDDDEPEDDEDWDEPEDEADEDWDPDDDDAEDDDEDEDERPRRRA